MIERSLTRKEAERISGISGDKFGDLISRYEEFIVTMEVKSSLATYYPYTIVTLLREINYLHNQGLSEEEIKVTLRSRVTAAR